MGKNTNILCSNLTYKKAVDIKIGDKLFAFDENLINKRRYYKFSKVINTRLVIKSTYEIILKNGDKLICSENHKWLSRYAFPKKREERTGIIRWIEAKKLLNNYNNRRRRGIEIIKLAPNKKKIINDYDTGYISAAFDGEGCLSSNKPRLVFSQKQNSMFENVKNILLKRKINFAIHDYPNIKQIDIHDGLYGVIGFLMRFKPKRLMDIWNNYNFSNNSLYNLKGEEVIDVNYIGKKELVIIETNTRTYIANGYASHS